MSTQINTNSNWRERKQEQQESSHFKSNIMQQSPSLYLLFSFALSHIRFFCLLCSILAPNRNSLYLIKNPATDFPYRPSTNLPSGRKSYTHRRQERNYPTSIPTRRCFNSQASGDGLWWENEKILKNQRSISIDDFVSQNWFLGLIFFYIEPKLLLQFIEGRKYFLFGKICRKEPI